MLRPTLARIAVCLAFLPGTALAAGPCEFAPILRGLMTIEPSAGKPLVSAEALEELRRDLPYSRLDYRVESYGKGQSGDVLRIVPLKRESASFVVKNMDSIDAAKDYAAFEALKEALEGNPAFRVPPVKWIRSKKPGRAYLQVSDVRGRTLYSVLADPTVPEEAKALLRKKYGKGATHLFNALQERLGIEPDKLAPTEFYFPSVFGDRSRLAGSDLREVPGQPKMLQAEQHLVDFFDSKQREPVLRKLLRHAGGDFQEAVDDYDLLKILLKSDNIIVTPEFDLVIIDPF